MGEKHVNKFETAVVVLLFLLLVAWGFLQKSNAPVPTPPVPAAEEGVQSAAVTPVEHESAAPAEPVIKKPVEVGELRQPERRVVLENDCLGLEISSWGGSVVFAELKEFRSTVDPASPSLRLDFSQRPALSIEGTAAFTTNVDFSVVGTVGSSGITLRALSPQGVVLERTIAMGSGYTASVSDTFSNSSSEAVVIEARSMTLGPMRNDGNAAIVKDTASLGVDTLENREKASVRHWGDKEIPAMFGAKTGMFSCSRDPAGPILPAVSGTVGGPVLWVAAKNQFFVQLLSPAGGALDAGVRAQHDEAASNKVLVADVSASLVLPGSTLLPGASVTSVSTYYVGPKKYDLLKDLPDRQAEVMQFGWFSWFCKILLWTLNALHRVIPNYGVAIIILTGLVRAVFWPVTRKSTESMKRMQDIQPEVAKLREKFKNDPQKMNQAVMFLYKQHKVNPMMGCLPMLIQIPVFFALYVVLRSAVELRFARFLWIRDLSATEGLLAGSIPFVGELNVLPLLMTATMVWQQHLTPSAGDPQQKKLMMLMPVFFLFLFYGMPSALVLYWTVSQTLAIVQLILQKREAAQPGTAVAKA
jgi:YidC/Oxa1 family membrane protein insertase